MKSKLTNSSRIALGAIAFLAAAAFAPAGATAQTPAPTGLCESQPLPRLEFTPAVRPFAQSNIMTAKIPAAPITVAAPDGELHLIVAAEERQRELGLMCIVAMKPHAGMLFVFAKSGPQSFWMKNTLIPLDMVFVRADGVVTSVAANVPRSRFGAPEADIARRNGEGRFVIELNAGEAAADGITSGIVLRIPAINAQ